MAKLFSNDHWIWEFNKVITPLALVGYESIIINFGATRLFGYFSPQIQSTLVEYLLNIPLDKKR